MVLVEDLVIIWKINLNNTLLERGNLVKFTMAFCMKFDPPKSLAPENTRDSLSFLRFSPWVFSGVPR